MITVTFTISEAENLCMMHDFCKRHNSHEFAVNAIAKIRKAIKLQVSPAGHPSEPSAPNSTETGEQIPMQQEKDPADRETQTVESGDVGSVEDVLGTPDRVPGESVQEPQPDKQDESDEKQAA